eukprot:TRINITY_DN3400_c2_g2_i1.p1 TRINITY_DN3400_c2_g2~~TRINITY_DN3400_c2_g2_i1.p1  ORF type:complete len:167 (+),score=3.91 TRINITY_DN3400_c2_g2_i1:47-547(+)
MDTTDWIDAEIIYPVSLSGLNVTNVGVSLEAYSKVIVKRLELLSEGTTRVTFGCSREGIDVLNQNLGALGAQVGTSIVHAPRNLCGVPVFSVASLVVVVIILFSAIIIIFCTIAFCRREAATDTWQASPNPSITPIELFPERVIIDSTTEPEEADLPGALPTYQKN